MKSRRVFSSILVSVFLPILFLVTVGISLTAVFAIQIKDAFADELSEREATLRKELERLEKEQAQVEASLNVQRSQSATLQRDVNILTGEINKTQLSIDQKNLIISQLGNDIGLKDQTIQQLNEKMERSMVSLAQLIKKTNQLDDTSLIEMVITNRSISDVFVDIDSYKTINDSLEALFDEIRDIRGWTEEEIAKLEEKQNQEQNIKAEIESEKRVIASKKNEKDGLLSVSKQSEKAYETVLAAKRQQAAAIRAALFNLRDTAAIPFGEAVKYAEAASKSTGVRTAFILAILQQESRLGQNVGTCNRAGDPESKKWYNIMPGAGESWRDDEKAFLEITSKLGLDPNTTPLSCPIGNGWGGAMGPSQFIPTTWQSYEARVAAAVGVSVANPWIPEHAFTATAIYMKDLGASAQTFTAEKTAALKYYAGGNWNQPQNQFYGNSVMSLAAGFEEQLKFLKDVDSQS